MSFFLAEQLQVLALSSGAPASGVKTLQTRSPRQGGGRFCAQSAGVASGCTSAGPCAGERRLCDRGPFGPPVSLGMGGEVGVWPALKGWGSELSAA